MRTLATATTESDRSHSSVPAFLRISRDVEGAHYKDCTFTHSESLGNSEAHALWWPPKTENHPTTVIIFIPGNPGILEFYVDFLGLLSDEFSQLAILAHGHLGHTPNFTAPSQQYTTLTAQVAAHIEALDAVTKEFGQSCRVILVGHSVGSWIAMQMIKERPSTYCYGILLCPTVLNISKSLNGHKLSWLMRHPFPQIISHLSLFSRLIPRPVLRHLFREWSPSQITILTSLICSPSVILAALSMANDEMSTILELDWVTFNQNKSNLRIFYALLDNWDGGHREEIKEILQDHSGPARVVYGHPDIPHAFSINHSSDVANHCIEWLKQLNCS